MLIKVQSDLARLVKDTDGSVVFLRLLNVVSVDDIAEYLYRISAAEGNGRSRETESARVRYGFCEVARKSLIEPVLAAVGFVRNENDVRAQRELRVLGLPSLRRNFSIVVKITSPPSVRSRSRRSSTSLACFTSPTSARGYFALVVELVVQIRAVNFDDEGRIIEHGLAAQDADEKNH